MATIIRRKGKREVQHRVQIRRNGTSQSGTFNDRRAAEQWAQIVEGMAGDEAAHTLADALARYRCEVMPSKADNTQAHYELHLAWWRRRLGSTLLGEITPQQITTHRDRFTRTLEPRTVNGYLASLSAVMMMMMAMMDWEWIETSLMTRVRNLPLPRGRIRYLSDDERTQLLAAAKASYLAELHPVVMTALATGGRKEEVLGLRWADVDRSRQQVTFHDTKNGDRRTVPVRGAAWDVLTAWGDQPVRRIDTELVWPRKDGRKPVDIRYAWEKVRDSAELTDLAFIENTCSWSK